MPTVAPNFFFSFGWGVQHFFGVMGSKTTHFNNIKKIWTQFFCLKILWSQANIRNTFIDQSSPQHREMFLFIYFLGEKKEGTFFLLCDHRSIVWIHSSTRALHDTGKRVFCDGMDRQTDRHKNIATLWLNWPSGPIQWKLVYSPDRQAFINFRFNWNFQIWWCNFYR